MALVKCPECGNEMPDMATACPKCGKPTGVQLKLKSRWGAAILNFIFWFPGYLYVGEYLLGVILLLFFIGGIIDYYIPPSTSDPYLLASRWIGGLLLNLLLAIDGYKRVEKYNQAQLKKQKGEGK